VSDSALRNDALPALFRAADRLSVSGQQSAVWRNGTYLGLLVIAAIGGVIDVTVRKGTLNLGGVLSVASFLGALLLGLQTANKQPERQWYQGRAVAESVKSLAWCYAVGGEPFPLSGDETADRVLADRLHRILNELRELDLPPVPNGSQVTPQMRALRSAPLEDRRRSYLADRVDDQRKWYTRKASSNRMSGNAWAGAAAVASAAGLILGLFRMAAILDVDLLGVLGTVGAAANSWIQFRQHRTLSTSYAVAAQDLGLVYDSASASQLEDDWAHFVSDAEEAISREHTMWLARRRRVKE